MTRHLDDDEIAIALAGDELKPPAAGHLESCLACRREVEALSEMLADRRRNLATGAPDWDLQRGEILSRLTRLTSAASSRGRARARWFRPLLAAAAVIALAVGLRVAWLPSAPADRLPHSELEVEEILAEVDEVLADDSLPGFEPIDPGFDVDPRLFDNGTS